MANTIEQNATLILAALATVDRDTFGDAEIPAAKLGDLTGLTPADINDAAAILVDSALVEWHQSMGTAPYNFGEIQITPRGRLELERSRKSSAEGIATAAIHPPVPIGSPYGFQDVDWETVSERKARSDHLYVVLGCQFESAHYTRSMLEDNVKQMFQHAVESYNQNPNAIKTALVFKPLVAGYGEHLFNEIARDIVSSDIAVFETSDLNPNVMLEMGVALTWGVRVLPIKADGCQDPPSDISGQTWAVYRDNAKEFEDYDHDRKLARMVERAMRKKAHFNV